MRRRLPFHIWLPGLLSILVAMSVGYVIGQYSDTTYEDYVESRAVAEGEIGGLAGEDIPRAQSIDDLLSYDRFTITSEGYSYMNDGAGFYDDMTLNNLELPSGERVAACINPEYIQFNSTPRILPVGRIVYEDLTQSEYFLNQIEAVYPLSRYDFYVDMRGEGGTVSQEERSSFWVEIAQIITVVMCFPVFHALGAKMGIFPYFFPPD